MRRSRRSNLLALEPAGARGTRQAEELSEIGRILRRSPEKVEEAIGLLEGGIIGGRRSVRGARCALFLGRGHSFPAALEGALKLKEISYLPAEEYPAGEMEHDPIALVDEQCPVVATLGEGLLREKTLSNIEETVARGARVIAVVYAGDVAAERMAKVTLPVPAVPEDLRRTLAPRLCRAAAATLLPRRQGPGLERGQAAQPRQERDGRVARG